MTQPADRITCPYCQARNFPSSEICWRCGRPLTAQTQPGPTPPPPQEPQQPQIGEQPPCPPPSRPAGMTTLVIVGFVLAALSVMCCFPSGIVSVILGAIAYAKGDRRGIWVMIAGAVGTILGAVMLGALIKLGAEMPSTGGSWPGV